MPNIFKHFSYSFLIFLNQKFQTRNFQLFFVFKRSPNPAAGDDQWTSDRQSSEVRSEERGGQYDGPAGMDPDGVIDSNWDEVTENFDDMNLREELLRGVYAYGFEKPSAIQQRAIVPCVKGHDVIAQAQSGTGKTATFSISILQQIDTKLAQCQVHKYPKLNIILIKTVLHLSI